MSAMGNEERAGVDDPGPEELRCPECGEVIQSGFEFCPECGGYVGSETSTDDDEDGRSRFQIGYAGYAGFGILSGLASFLLVPLLLGPVCVFCGVQVFRRHGEAGGVALVLLGIAGTVAGWLFGPLV